MGNYTQGFIDKLAQAGMAARTPRRRLKIPRKYQVPAAVEDEYARLDRPSIMKREFNSRILPNDLQRARRWIHDPAFRDYYSNFIAARTLGKLPLRVASKQMDVNWLTSTFPYMVENKLQTRQQIIDTLEAAKERVAKKYKYTSKRPPLFVKGEIGDFGTYPFNGRSATPQIPPDVAAKWINHPPPMGTEDNYKTLKALGKEDFYEDIGGMWGSNNVKAKAKLPPVPKPAGYVAGFKSVIGKLIPSVGRLIR